MTKLIEAQNKWKRTLQSTVFRNHRISNACVPLAAEDLKKVENLKRIDDLKNSAISQSTSVD